VRFGISTHLYHEQKLGSAQLRELAEFGFRDIELFATIGHVDYHDDRALDQLAAWLDEAGLRLHSVHAPIVEHLVNGQWGPALSTAAGVEQARQRAVSEARAAAAIARRVPYSFLVVHLGVPDEFKPGPDDNAAAAARRSVEEIAESASAAGVQLAVELIPNEISTAERLVRLLEEDVELRPPGAGICLDMGHAFLTGDLVDAIEVVAGHLVTTHVHDNRGKADDHLVPFEGRIDWPAALMSLQKVGYDGLIMFELANTGDPRDVLRKTVETRARFEEIVTDY
jgi:sugar phosphate isomerase/epimerase